MRHTSSKLERLQARYPGLQDKVHAMFAEFWAPREVKQMIETQYGERLSLRTIERYKQRHWEQRRELVQQMSAALAASPEFAGLARLERGNADLMFRSAAPSPSSG